MAKKLNIKILFMKAQPMGIPLPQPMATVEDDPPNDITRVWFSVLLGHELIEPKKAMMSIKLDHFRLTYLHI